MWTNSDSGRVAVISAVFLALANGADPALTIYNQNFAVIREIVPLDLKAGSNSVRYSGATNHLEPGSVILRDPTSRRPIQVLEQSYRNDSVSQERLLNLFEGQTIDFLVRRPDGTTDTVRGKVIRSNYVPNRPAMNRYGSAYANTQMAAGSSQPIIEVNGKMQFSLPGQPLFPALGGDAILKPTLEWILYSNQPARIDAELSYVSGGMTWNADYNVISPENGDTLDLAGWVTLDNQSGRQFDNAHIKLMAGDVSKIQPMTGGVIGAVYSAGGGNAGAPPAVTERTFEDYHLYTLPRPATIHDREMKQVEFLRASGRPIQTAIHLRRRDLRPADVWGCAPKPAVRNTVEPACMDHARVPQ